jgi:hypothetical protein
MKRKRRKRERRIARDREAAAIERLVRELKRSSVPEDVVKQAADTIDVISRNAGKVRS